MSVELIADGFHVHPAVVKLVLAAKAEDGLILVTDAISATGMPDGEYALGGLPVWTKEGKATPQDVTLAGSLLTLDAAVRNMVSFTGIPLWRAVRMASLAPAKVLGLDKDYGSIAKGKKANLAIMDEAFRVERVYREGREILS